MRNRILCVLFCVICLFPGHSPRAESTEFDMNTLAEDFVYVFRAENPTVAVAGLERNADERCYPASTTKILTCILALESGKLDYPVLIPDVAESNRVLGSVMGIHKDEVYTLLDLVYGLMLPSGNDAANAIAVALAGSLDSFSDQMNQKAEALGMTHSHFVTPSGIHNDDHYTTARDMALLTSYAMQNEQFRLIVRTATHTVCSSSGRKIVLRTSNRFLRDYQATNYRPQSVLYDACIGVKTGETSKAGKCLIAAAEQNGITYIAILLHGQMPPEKSSSRQKDAYSVRRYLDARALLEFAFLNDICSITVHDLIFRCLPESLVLPIFSDVFGSGDAYCRILWNPNDSFSAPMYLFQDAFLQDPFPSKFIRYDRNDRPPALGSILGRATVTIDGIDYFSAPIICDEIHFENDVQPSPAMSSPAPAEPIFASPAATERPFWNLWSCRPVGQSR